MKKQSMMAFALALFLLPMEIGCAKKVQAQVQVPVSGIAATDRITAVLNSNLSAEQKVQIIHDILDRESNRGQNLMSSWKETLAWLSAIITLAVR